MLYVTFWEDLTMWKVVQCSVQGKGHIKDFIPCQDKTYYYKKDDITVTACYLIFVSLIGGILLLFDKD